LFIARYCLKNKYIFFYDGFKNKENFHQWGFFLIPTDGVTFIRPLLEGFHLELGDLLPLKVR